MTPRLAAWLAAALLLAPVCAKAQAPIETTVAVRDLIGLDPLAVRSHVAAVPADWPLAAPGLSLISDHGLLSFIASADLIEDPAEALLLERANSYAYGQPVPPHLECKTFIGQPDGAYGENLSLMFTDGRLTAIYRDPPSPPPSAAVVPHGADGKADMAAMAPPPWAVKATPRPSPFIAAAGQLPLLDGDAFTGRWSKQALPLDATLTTRCAPWQAQVMPTPKPGRSVNSSDDIGLLPLAVLEPPINAARTGARKNGRAVLGKLTLGASLGASPDDFAASTRGVRLFRDTAAGYAVIALDMGALPGNYIGNTDDVAMIGVKDDKVVWIVASGWRTRWPMGLSADLLCLDDRFIPGRTRPGCDASGTYKP